MLEAGPAPILNVLNPPSGETGTKLAFSVHGTGFSPGAVIVFNGKKIPSKRIRRDEIQADPELDLTGIPEGKYKVWVENADGKKSKEEEFLVEGKDPTPVLDRILPFFLYLDDSSNVLAVYGVKFRKGLTLKIGNTVISGADINYKSTTYFEAKVDTTKGSWTAGDFQTVVINPNGKPSNAFKMTVTYRIPSIANVTPSGWTDGCATKVEVHGSNFVPKASVKIGSLTFSGASTTNKLTFVNDKKLEFTLDKGKLSSGTHSVQVLNGPSAKSTTVNFLVSSQASVPKPEIREIRPSSARADTKVSLLMYYNGSGRFWQGAIVMLDGKRQKTSCSSTSTTCYTLGAELDLTGVKPGKHLITVVNPCGQLSDSFPFYVSDAPSVHLTSISPAFAKPGEKKRLVLKGINFTGKSTLSVDGKAVPVTFKSETELLTSGDVDFTGAKAGSTVDVFVDNNNGQKSKTLKYAIIDANAKLYITAMTVTEFERGKVHNGVSLNGAGFTATSEVYFDGKKMTAKYVSPFQMTVDGFDFTTLKVGVYYVYVKNGADTSNYFPVYAKPNKEPLLSYVRPALLYTGRPSTTFYAYGRYFCELTSATSRTCKTNPKIVIIGPNNTDVSSSFSITRIYPRAGWTYDGYAYGRLNSTSWKNGDYKVYFELPTGERSNAGVIVVKPPPPPSINYITPAGSKKGTTPRVRVYGSNFVSGATVLIGLQSFSTTGSGTYLYVNINTSVLKEGSHQLIVMNPDQQQSNKVSFTVYPTTTPPIIQYTSPDVTYEGSTSLTIYGQGFSNPMVVKINGALVSSTYYSSTSYQYLRVTGWKAPKATGPYKVQVADKAGTLSNIFELGNAGGGGPFIRYLSPDYRAYSSPTYSTYLYIYGFGFDSAAKVLVDGTSITPTYRTTSLYLSSGKLRLNGYKNYKIQIKNSDGKLSNVAYYGFTTSSSSALRMTSNYPSSAVAGESKYAKGSAYVYGSGFKTTSKIYLDGKLLKTRYSSATRLYIDEELDFTGRTKASLSHMEVRDGTAKSNTQSLRIETGLSRLNRSRFTLIEPYAVSKNTKSVVLSASSSYLYSSNGQFYEALIEGTGVSKVYPITYLNGRWTFTIDTTGWAAGVYNVYARNKATKERSGGSGLVVLP